LLKRREKKPKKKNTPPGGGCEEKKAKYVLVWGNPRQNNLMYVADVKKNILQRKK